MAIPKPQDPYRLASLRKGLEVIDCFARRETWTLAELAAALDLSKPTIFRILHTLEEFGFLTKDADSGRYALGLRFHALGSAALRREHLRWQALPPLQDLAEFDRRNRPCRHPACVGSDLRAGGGRNPPDSHAGFRGQAYAGPRQRARQGAAGPPSVPELDRLLAGCVLSGFTPNTLTDPDALRTELNRIRAQGWGMDNEEIETGLRCLGVPITDHTGRVSACVALSAPAARMEPEDISALLPRLQDTASRISVMLGSPIRQAA